MQKTLVKRVTRRNPFRPRTVPLLARIYRYPHDKWPTSRGRQLLFGAPNLAAYSLLRRIQPFGGVGSFEVDLPSGPASIRFDARNTQFQSVYMKAFSNGYEPELTALFDLIVKQQDTFVDVGSNWGFFSLFVASRRGFAGRVLAYEPFPSTFKDLVAVVEESGLGKVIECRNVALSDFEGRTNMSLPDHTHSGLATIGKSGASCNGQILVGTLDSLAEKASVIKIDAEGSEGAILQGGKDYLRRNRPLLVLENWRNFSNVGQTLVPLKLLEELDYVLYHPCWVREFEGRKYFLAAESSHDLRSVENLALVPISFENRFLRHDQINILACHRDRVAALESEFDSVPDLRK